MKLGAHCVLFGAKTGEQPEAVFSMLAKTGAQGVEVGERFFSTENADRMKSALDVSGVELAGMHCNNLKLPDLINDPDKAEAALRTTAAFMAGMKNKNVIATGGIGFEKLDERPIRYGAVEEELHQADLVVEAAKRLNGMAQSIRSDFGVAVNYHNHCWEFADDGLIFKALMEYAPDLHFALDTGWAAVSGYDPVDLIEQLPDRIHYVHLRDYLADENALSKTFGEVHKGFIQLGTGAMDYNRLMSALTKRLSDGDWAVVEYEIGNFNEESYEQALSYLKENFDV